MAAFVLGVRRLEIHHGDRLAGYGYRASGPGTKSRASSETGGVFSRERAPVPWCSRKQPGLTLSRHAVRHVNGQIEDFRFIYVNGNAVRLVTFSVEELNGGQDVRALSC